MATLHQTGPGETAGFERPRSAARPEIGRIEYAATPVLPVADETLERNRVLCPLSPAEAVAAYKILRTQTLRRLDASGWNTLAVLSAAPSEGKTLTATNLAVSIARDRHHTAMLVDLDLHRPTVHRVFEHRPRTGVDQYLRGTAGLADGMFNPGLDGLVVLPASAPLAESSELLASERARAMVDELRGRFRSRVVIFDLPPVLAADDALAFLPLVDAALVVIEERRTRRHELQRALELVSASTPVVGTVLNRASAGATPYYYY